VRKPRGRRFSSRGYYVHITPGITQVLSRRHRDRRHSVKDIGMGGKLQTLQPLHELQPLLTLLKNQGQGYRLWSCARCPL